MISIESSFGPSGHIRKAGFLLPVVVVLLAGCNAGIEQDHEFPAPPSSPKEQERLGTIFQGYEATRLTRMGIRYRFKRTEVDPTFNTRDIFSGEVVMKDPDLYRVEIRNDKGQLAELFVWNGNAVYMAKFHQKETCVFEPSCTRDSEEARRHNECLDGFRKMLTGHFIGLPIDEVKTSFHFQLEQEDKDWIYLKLLPRTSSVKANYQRTRVKLDRKTFRIGQIWYGQANGSEVFWDFEMPIKEKQPITEEALLQDFPKKQVRFPKP
jgi:hypothetical protein